MRWVLVFLAALFAAPAFGGNFSNWAAIVVAGDGYASSGAPSEVFDNARRDISHELIGMGFSPANIRQFSTRPEKYADHPELSTPKHVAQALLDLSGKAPGGCLAYFTSHGNEDGVVIGDTMTSPRYVAYAIDKACSGKPAVIVVSSCYSGVFVPRLKKPDRIVITAAAANRSSFGCSEDEKYNYFDTCTIALMPKAGDFETLGRQAITCVRAREKKEGMSPPSNPQLAVGDKARDLVPHWK